MTATAARHEMLHGVARRHALLDVLMVLFVTLLLGAFVAQLAAPPSPEVAARQLQASAACRVDGAAC